jgi:hypothetical protein
MTLSEATRCIPVEQFVSVLWVNTPQINERITVHDIHVVLLFVHTHITHQSLSKLYYHKHILFRFAW